MDIQEKLIEAMTPDAKAALERGEGRAVEDAEVRRVCEFLVSAPEDVEDMLARIAMIEGMRRGMVDFRWNAEAGELMLRLHPAQAPATVPNEDESEAT